MKSAYSNLKITYMAFVFNTANEYYLQIMQVCYNYYISKRDSYDFWKTCKANGTYTSEKEQLAADFIEILAKKYPQTAGKIAVWDVATPLTYERYLGSYKGSWMTIAPKGSDPVFYPSKPISIRNVYFDSQRLYAPSWLPVALDSGRRAIQYLCKDTNTVFQDLI